MAGAKTVLIIEDDRDTAETIADALRRAGHSPAVAANRDEGAAFLDTLAPDLVLLDYWMKGMSASVFASRCRRVYPNVKIAIFSAAKDASSVAHFLDADTYFNKPLDFDKLLSYVEAL